MDVVEDAYGSPLAQREELAGLLSGYAAMATRTGRLDDPAVAVALTRAHELLTVLPCDVAPARLAVTTFRELVRASSGRSGPGSVAAQSTATSPGASP